MTRCQTPSAAGHATRYHRTRDGGVDREVGAGVPDPTPPTDAGGRGSSGPRTWLTYAEPDPLRVIAVSPADPGMPVTPSVGDPDVGAVVGTDLVGSTCARRFAEAPIPRPARRRGPWRRTRRRRPRRSTSSGCPGCGARRPRWRGRCTGSPGSGCPARRAAGLAVVGEVEAGAVAAAHVQAPSGPNATVPIEWLGNCWHQSLIRTSRARC